MPTLVNRSGQILKVAFVSPEVLSHPENATAPWSVLTGESSSDVTYVESFPETLRCKQQELKEAARDKSRKLYSCNKPQRTFATGKVISLDANEVDTGEEKLVEKRELVNTATRNKKSRTTSPKPEKVSVPHAEPLVKKPYVRPNKTYELNCKYCGNLFEAHRSDIKCCSASCVTSKQVEAGRRGASYSLRNQTWLCEKCGEGFVPQRSDSRYCSRKCAASINAKKRHRHNKKQENV